MELQQSYDSIQQEREVLEAELQHCRTELNHLMDKKSQVRLSSSTERKQEVPEQEESTEP